MKRQLTLQAATGEAKTRIQGWLAGAATIYGMVSGKDGSALLKQLEQESAPSVAADMGYSPITFTEGRSTPPPPRPPGAQRSVV